MNYSAAVCIGHSFTDVDKMKEQSSQLKRPRTGISFLPITAVELSNDLAEACALNESHRIGGEAIGGLAQTVSWYDSGVFERTCQRSLKQEPASLSNLIGEPGLDLFIATSGSVAHRGPPRPGKSRPEQVAAEFGTSPQSANGCSAGYQRFRP